MDRLVVRGVVPDETIELATDHYLHCSMLLQLVDDPFREHEAWITRAAENGDPIAKSRLAILLRRDKYSVEEKIEFLSEALETRHEDAYYLAGVFLTNQSPYENINKREAWYYLACKADTTCDLKTYSERMLNKYQPHQIYEIARIAEELQVAIMAGETPDLGL